MYGTTEKSLVENNVKNTVNAQNIYANALNRIRFAASLSYEVLIL